MTTSKDTPTLIPPQGGARVGQPYRVALCKEISKMIEMEIIKREG